MGRKTRVNYNLDTGNIKALSEEEIKAILRAADELIASGGRSLLAKILKGSKDKRVLELGLMECPSYGFYHSLTLEEITHRIDWMIKKHYLKIEYSGRLPVLVFSDRGWEIERETYVEEMYGKCLLAAKENDMQVIRELKEANRQVVFRVLEKIRASKDLIFCPFLEEWKKSDVRKVRERIDDVKRTIEKQEEGPVLAWLNASKSDANQIAALVERTILETYPAYYSKEVTDFFCFLHSLYRIQADIEHKHVWMLLCDGRLVGTGSRTDNHITRVYVPKEEQGKGFGSYIMRELENQVKRKFGRAELDASLPAEHFYENRGYRTIRQETISMGDAVFSYRVMAKVFAERAV